MSAKKPNRQTAKARRALRSAAAKKGWDTRIARERREIEAAENPIDWARMREVAAEGDLAHARRMIAEADKMPPLPPERVREIMMDMADRARAMPTSFGKAPTPEGSAEQPQAASERPDEIHIRPSWTHPLFAWAKFNWRPLSLAAFIVAMLVIERMVRP